MNLTCQNCGQKRVERPQVHAGRLRCTLERGFETPGCIAPAQIGRTNTPSNIEAIFLLAPATCQEMREMVQGRGQETARIALIVALKINLANVL